MYKLVNVSLIKISAKIFESSRLYLFNREINKYITHKMDMFTWKNFSLRPMLFSNRENPYRISVAKIYIMKKYTIIEIMN